MNVQKAISAVGCLVVSVSILEKAHSGLAVIYQHHPLQPDCEPKELHSFLHSLLVAPPARSLHHGKGSLEPSRPVQDEEHSDTRNEGGTAGTKIRAHGGSCNLDSPAGNDHAVEQKGFVLTMQAPVQLEAEQVLRVWADLVHGRVLVANIHLVLLRHDGRRREVLGEVADILMMERKVSWCRLQVRRSRKERANVQVGEVTRGGGLFLEFAEGEQ